MAERLMAVLRPKATLLVLGTFEYAAGGIPPRIALHSSSRRVTPMLRFAPLALGLVLTLLLGVPTPVGAQAATRAAASPVAAGGDFAGLVDIGDRRKMYLECRGTGSPRSFW